VWRSARTRHPSGEVAFVRLRAFVEFDDGSGEQRAAPRRIDVEPGPADVLLLD
jgi:hypothetical protein